LESLSSAFITQMQSVLAQVWPAASDASDQPIASGYLSTLGSLAQEISSLSGQETTTGKTLATTEQGLVQQDTGAGAFYAQEFQSVLGSMTTEVQILGTA
jgi:hypothetical protein